MELQGEGALTSVVNAAPLTCGWAFTCAPFRTGYAASLGLAAALAFMIAPLHAETAADAGSAFDDVTGATTAETVELRPR